MDTDNRRLNGLAVRVIRNALGISLSDLATRIGKDTGYLSRIEAKGKGCSGQTRRDIAEALGVPLDAITYPLCQCDCHLKAAA